MFKEAIDKWNTSSQEREDKFTFSREIHNGLMDMKNICSLMEKSIGNCLEISKNGLVLSIDKDGSTFKMYLNEDDYKEVPITVLCNGNYEVQETDMVCRLLRYFKDDEDFVMFDVGANVGWYSLNASKCIPALKLYAFEPGPITYQRLVNNLELNGIKRETAINVGFYKENGKLDFYYDKTRSGASSLINIQEKDAIEKISVDMIKMDDWAEENNVGKVDFIKCDVEGSELFVYEGGMELIAKSKPIIFSEMLRKWSAKFGYHPNDIIRLFTSIGYECFVIMDAHKLKKIDLVDEDTVETNFFFLHSEKHAKIIQELCV